MPSAVARRAARPSRCPATPDSANRSRQRATAPREMSSSAAMSLFSLPSAAASTIRALVTSRAWVLRPRDHRSRVVRSASLRVI